MTDSMPRYASTSEIFEREEVLREDYRPDELPEREGELDSLHMALSPAARGVGANNAFLYGKAGQGKTAATKKSSQSSNTMPSRSPITSI